MKKVIIAALAIAVIAGGAAMADPGPNGHNNFGLCTAYAHNSPNSHQAPPFQALEQAAEDAGQTVEEWCAENAPHPGNRP